MWWSWKSWRLLDRGGLAAMFCGASVAVLLPGSQGIKASRHQDPPILPLFSLSRVSSSSSSSLHLFFPFFLFASFRRLLFFSHLVSLFFFSSSSSSISFISSTFQPGSLRPLFLPLSLS